MSLTPKQQRFVDEYLIDLNASAAYRRAGYVAKTENVAAVEGHRLLSNPNVRAAVEAGKAQRSEKVGLTRDYVINGLMSEATYRGVGASHSARVTALKHLGDHLGLFPSKHEHTGADGGPIRYEQRPPLTHEERADRIIAILEQRSSGGVGPGASENGSAVAG